MSPGKALCNLGRNPGHLQTVRIQGLLRQLVESGALNHLDSDQQWSLRMLLPRRDFAPTATPAAPAPAYLPAHGQTAAAIPPAMQLAGTNDSVMALMAALLKPQMPAPQVSAAGRFCSVSCSGFNADRVLLELLLTLVNKACRD